MQATCFAIGMLAVFATLGGAASPPDWHLMIALPAALLLTRQSRFASRYHGSRLLLQLFASLGLITLLMPAILRHIVASLAEPGAAILLGSLHMLLLIFFGAVTLHALPRAKGRSSA